MYPILFTLGSLEIRSYPVFLVLGIILGVSVAWKEGKRIGFNDDYILTFCLAAIPFALILGALNGLLFNINFYRALRNSQIVLSGGLVSFGVTLGTLLLGIIYARLHKQPAGKTLDVIVLALPVILGVLRIGCFLNGCCYGRETDGFGGIYLPDLYGNWAYRYPTQIMLGVLDLLLFIFLWRRRKSKPFEGSQAIFFLIWHSIGRLIIDSFRALPPVVGPFSFHQLASIAILMFALGLLLRLRIAKRSLVR